MFATIAWTFAPGDGEAFGDAPTGAIVICIAYGGYMRDGGLVERLDRAVTLGHSADVPLHRLGDVARALREVTERTASAIESPPDDAIGEHGQVMPQILQYPLSTSAGTELEPAGRSHGQALAPAILALSIVTVGVLMTASFADLQRVPGLAVLSEKPSPRLSPPRVPPLTQAGSGDAPSVSSVSSAFAQPALSIATFEDIVREPRNLGAGQALSLDELALLERCESLIAAGDIQAARQELAKAASTGSANARFALAETFDPNVLAAWGLRDRVADAGTARVLYEQAYDAGDLRAEARLSALRELH
jgi:hypothetical protein